MVTGRVPVVYSCNLCVYVWLQVGFPWYTVKMYPFMLHSVSMSIFASVIGPFGGFFASGFKRAFKIKVSKG